MSKRSIVTNEIRQCMELLFPISRSLTGIGNRKTLKILQDIVPLKIKEYPSGQEVYDWVIPKEWNIKDGWIKNSQGEKIVDFKKSNLHVVGYSQPVKGKLTFKELVPHLHYKENLPCAVPYRTSYYNDYWGFCVSYDDFKKYFREGEKYEVFIDSNLEDGSLSLGELLIPGKKNDEFLISTYICHPSLANDNLSGIVLTTFLAKKMLEMKLNYSYRIVFVPETIGAVAYCKNNEDAMKKVMAGIIISCVGGPGIFSLKPSFEEKSFVDIAARKVLTASKQEFKEYEFVPQGSDERQYSSPGFRIPCITICRDKYCEYDYYHTSLDNLDFVKAENIFKSIEMHMRLIKEIDSLKFYERTESRCELQLGKRGLYPKIGALNRIDHEKKPWRSNELDALYWVLFYADGKTSVDQMIERSQMNKKQILDAIKKLEEKKLLQKK